MTSLGFGDYLNMMTQANSEILSLMQITKDSAEHIIQTLPDLYAVIDSEGAVFKSNNRYADLAGCPVEDSHFQNFSSLFEAQNWASFQSKLKQVKPLGDMSKIAFELPIRTASGEHLFQYWAVEPLFIEFNDSLTEQKQFYSVIGRDVTQLRVYQKELQVKERVESLWASTKELSIARSEAEALKLFASVLLKRIALSDNCNLEIFLAKIDLQERENFYHYQIVKEGKLLEKPIAQSNVGRRIFNAPVIRHLKKAVLETGSSLIIPIFAPNKKKSSLESLHLLGLAKIDGYNHESLDDEEGTFVDALAASLGISLRNLYYAEEKANRATLDAQLQAVEMIQNSLLPGKVESPAISMISSFKPASVAGGDWFTCHYTPQNESINILLGDVTGHGIPSALITGVVAGAVHALHALADEEWDLSLLRLANLVNRVLFQLGKQQYPMTMNFLELNLETGTLNFVNAGHTFPLLIQRGAKRPRALIGPSARLGTELDAEFSLKSYQLEPGDRVFLYSDGLLENESAEHKSLRLMDLKKFLLLDEDIFFIHNKLISHVNKLWKDNPIEDDVTTLMFQWNGPVSQFKGTVDASSKA